jgi:uncharacterized protein YjbI with pentapeptide repeats
VTDEVEKLLLHYRIGERNFPAIDLREANLSGADLSGANLSGANFEIANLGGANLSNANLRRANFNVARLNGINLRRANLTEATLNVTNLARADLRGAILVNADLVRGELMRADLSAADLTMANLHGADLQEAQLRRAYLPWCNLENANLSTAILEGANLEQAKLHSTDLRRAILSGAELQGADLIHANLTGANLSGANLSGANLRWADLSGANLRWADLTNAKLSGATLVGTDLTHAILRGSSLIQADLTQSTLINVDWFGANISGVTLTGARIYGVSRFGLKAENIRCAWVDLSPNGDLSQTRMLNAAQSQQFFREGVPGVEITIDLHLDYHANFVLASLYHQLMQRYSYLKYPPNLAVMVRRTVITFQLQQEKLLFALAYLVVFPFLEAEDTRRNLVNVLKEMTEHLEGSSDAMLVETLQQVKIALEPLVNQVKPVRVPYPEKKVNFFEMPIQVLLVNSNQQSLLLYRSPKFGKRMIESAQDGLNFPEVREEIRIAPPVGLEQALEFLTGFYWLG